MANNEEVSCEDFKVFKNFLKEKRKLEDTINIELNKLNNEPERCKQLWKTLISLHEFRKSSIKRCINFTEFFMERLTNEGGDKREVYMARAQINFLHTELKVENVLRDSVAKAFKSKCSSYDIDTKPSKFNTKNGRKVTEETSAEDSLY
eukprot:TRINITY_DN6188_c0_g1_i1.p1 TRINITY_DN6188_c0_g1~~TRINITY_DN6188_c0_g1_i1.p1  ORF type:complete len:149 (-),score=23.06 TRINITY_DN6188_c0_g1_i1:73-519(-)